MCFDAPSIVGGVALTVTDSKEGVAKSHQNKNMNYCQF